MSDRTDWQDTVHRGNEAKRKLESPENQQLVRAIEDALYVRWRATSPKDTAERESIWFEQHGLDLLQKELTRPIGDGTIAAQQLKDDNYQRNLG